MKSSIRNCLLIATCVVALMPIRGQAADPITLQWQTPNLVETQYEPVWKQMIAAFEAENPGVKIEPILVARKDHWTRFVTASQAHRAPCVVEVDTIPAAYNGYLLPIDKYWKAAPQDFRTAWSDDVLKGARWDGNLYGVPIWGGVYGEIYNRKLVVAAGLNADKPPQSWDEYLTWMKALTKPGQQWGTAITAGPTDTTTRTLLSWIWSNGGEAFNDSMTEATFAKNPKSLQAIRFYIDLVRQGVAAPGTTTTNYLEQTNLFEQGKIASMRTAYWAIAKAEGDVPSLKGQMFVTAPPATIQNPPVVFDENISSISASCAYPDQAWKFIAFESQPKWAILRATVADWLPLRNDLINNPQIQSDPNMLAFLKMAQNARAYPLASPIWTDIAADDIVAAVQKAILNPDQVEPIFKALDAQLTRKLKEG